MLRAAVAVLRWPIVGPVALRGATGIAFELARYPGNRAHLRSAIALEADVARDSNFAEERWALAALAVALLRTPIPKVVFCECPDNSNDPCLDIWQNNPLANTGNVYGPFASVVACVPGSTSDIIEYRIEAARLVARLAKSLVEAGALGALGCIEALVAFVSPEPVVGSHNNVVLPVIVTALRNLSTHPLNHGQIAQRAAGILWRNATPHKRDVAAKSEAAIIIADAAAAVVNLLHSQDPIVRTYLYRIQVMIVYLSCTWR